MTVRKRVEFKVTLPSGGCAYAHGIGDLRWVITTWDAETLANIKIEIVSVDVLDEDGKVLEHIVPSKQED